MAFYIQDRVTFPKQFRFSTFSFHTCCITCIHLDDWTPYALLMRCGILWVFASFPTSSTLHRTHDTVNSMKCIVKVSLFPLLDFTPCVGNCEFASWFTESLGWSSGARFPSSHHHGCFCYPKTLGSLSASRVF